MRLRTNSLTGSQPVQTQISSIRRAAALVAKKMLLDIMFIIGDRESALKVAGEEINQTWRAHLLTRLF